MIMNLAAFNSMCIVLSGVFFNIWFWVMRPWAGYALLITLVIWILGNVTAGKIKKK